MMDSKRKGEEEESMGWYSTESKRYKKQKRREELFETGFGLKSSYEWSGFSHEK